MASQPEFSEISATIERLVRTRDLSLFLPFLFGLSNTDLRQQNDNNNNNRVILINPFTQGMVVIEGASSLESLLRELGNISNNVKEGQPPASKSAVEALPRVEIREECEIGDCAICLEEFCVGGFVKEMPCKHRFHGDCVERWLGIHGTCPVCRHKMPVEEGESESKSSVSQREIWVSFSLSNSVSDNGRRSDEEEEELDEEEVVEDDDDEEESILNGLSSDDINAL